MQAYLGSFGANRNIRLLTFLFDLSSPSWREYRETAVRTQLFHALALTSVSMVSSKVQMEALVSALPYAEIILSILLIVGIVLQQRGATLGGAFGGDNFASTFYKRRGAEKFLFNATIAIAVLLVLAAVANFLLVG
jgi:protein translocase SecG subunit